MAKLLIVDDEIRIREVVKEYALMQGYEVLQANDGNEALSILEDNVVDCVVLDIMMPNLDGFSTCKLIKSKFHTPIIMLSARQEEYDKLFCFEMGVDDYVVKPFSPKELMARIKVVVDRNNGNKKASLIFGGLVVDTEGRNVFIDEEKATLTPKEFDLLVYLIKNKNIAISRSKILEEVWNYDYCGDDRTVDTHIKMLRHSLKDYRNMVVTVRGMGYKFEV